MLTTVDSLRWHATSMKEIGLFHPFALNIFYIRVIQHFKVIYIFILLK